jgi:hypothetical protein
MANPVPRVQASFTPVLSEETITIPETTASALFASTKKKLGLTSINENIPGWNFFQNKNGKDLGYAGKTYAVMTWKMKRRGTMWYQDLRELFRKEGFTGNIPAFLVWLSTHHPLELDKTYATAPDDEEMFHWKDRDQKATMYHLRSEGESMLNFLSYPIKCSPDETYIVFREVTTPPVRKARS